MSDFVECATCAAKCGSPTLCDSCIANRLLIGNLKGDLSRACRRIDDLHRLGRALMDVIGLLMDEVQEPPVDSGGDR